MKFCFDVDGVPRPKERPRVCRSGRTFTPVRTREYESRIKAQCMTTLYAEPAWGAQWPLDGEYRVDIIVYASGGVRADLDNIAKAILDAMQGVAYQNDRQVSHLSIMRLQGEPRAEVTVTMLSRQPEKAPSAAKRAVRGPKQGVQS